MQRAKNRPRRRDLAQKPLRQVERRQQSRRPPPTPPSPTRGGREGRGGEHLARTGVGVFVDLLAGEEVMKEVRHEKQRLGRVQQRRMVAPQRYQLEERVKPHELDAGPAEQLFARHPGERRFHDPLGVRIAVATGIAQQNAASAEQGEIDAPSIHADRIRPAVVGRAFSQRQEHVAVQPQHVPGEGVQRPDRLVGEAGQDIQAQPAAVEMSEHGPTAFRAEIESKDFRHGEHPPASGGVHPRRWASGGVHPRRWASGGVHPRRLDNIAPPALCHPNGGRKARRSPV